MLALLSTALSPTLLIAPTWSLFPIVCLSSLVWSRSIQPAGHCCVNGSPRCAPMTLALLSMTTDAWSQSIYLLTIQLSRRPFEMQYAFYIVMPDVCIMSSLSSLSRTPHLQPMQLCHFCFYAVSQTVGQCLSLITARSSSHALQQPYLFQAALVTL